MPGRGFVDTGRFPCASTFEAMMREVPKRSAPSTTILVKGVVSASDRPRN